MARRSNPNHHISIRLPSEFKDLVEQAATLAGQTLSDFVRTVLAREAERVLAESRPTRISDRDRDALLAWLEGDTLQPNGSLEAAARRYKTRLALD